MLAFAAPGDVVQTPLGKGVVREVRTSGHLVVEIGERRVVVAARDVRPIAAPSASSRRKGIAAVQPSEALAAPRTPRDRVAEVDLHGLTVADAVECVAVAVNDALIAGRLQLRVIHGRGGGRIKVAIHHQLRGLSPVRAFQVDPRNDGVTIVEF